MSHRALPAKSDREERRRPGLRGIVRTACYARSWKAGANVVVEEVEIQRAGERVPASLILPSRGSPPFPGWIALGGVSRMGRHHPQLVRFAHALASTGAAVLVPEVPEWRRLRMAPRVTEPTIHGCVSLLRSRPDVGRGRIGMIGFSFGAPQVAIAAARDEVAQHVGGVVLFGGYCCLERTMTCLLTGRHEWEGEAYDLRPDPFGGWVVGSNHLTDVPGCEHASDVAGALHTLAAAASGLRIPAWDSRHDPLIGELRAALPKRRQRLFDLFATPSSVPREEPEEAADMARSLAEACRRSEPLLDPATDLARVGIPTQLIHGRGDRLIPFTEGLRLHGSLPESARRGLTITSLFNHTADHAPPGFIDKARESVKMLAAIWGMIHTV